MDPLNKRFVYRRIQFRRQSLRNDDTLSHDSNLPIQVLFVNENSGMSKALIASPDSLVNQIFRSRFFRVFVFFQGQRNRLTFFG